MAQKLGLAVGHFFPTAHFQRQRTNHMNDYKMGARNLSAARLNRLTLAVALIFSAGLAAAADFDVTSPGFFYRINNQEPDPTISLTRGQTYTFAVNTAFDHPFAIVVNPNTGVLYQNGVQNNNISSGTITFSV